MIIAIPTDCSQADEVPRNSNIAKELDALGDGRSSEGVEELHRFFRRLRDRQILIVESMS
jgi:hypothetical protein